MKKLFSRPLFLIAPMLLIAPLGLASCATDGSGFDNRSSSYSNSGIDGLSGYSKFGNSVYGGSSYGSSAYNGGFTGATGAMGATAGIAEGPADMAVVTVATDAIDILLFPRFIIEP